MLKKFLSFALCLTMLFTVLPLGVSANAQVSLSATEHEVADGVKKLVFGAPGYSYSEVGVTLSYDNTVIVPVHYSNHTPLEITNGYTKTLPFDTALTEINDRDETVDARMTANWSVSGNRTSVSFSVFSQYGNTFNATNVFEFYYRIADGKENSIPANAFTVQSTRVVSGGNSYSPACVPQFKKSLMGTIALNSNYSVGDTATPIKNLSPSDPSITYRWYLDGSEIPDTVNLATYTIQRADAGKQLQVIASIASPYLNGTVYSNTAAIAPLTEITSVPLSITAPSDGQSGQTSIVGNGYTGTIEWSKATYAIGDTPTITRITLTPSTTSTFKQNTAVSINGTAKNATMSGTNLVVEEDHPFAKITSDITSITLNTASDALVPNGAKYSAALTSSTPASTTSLGKNVYTVTAQNGYLFADNLSVTVLPDGSTISAKTVNPDNTVTVTVEFKPATVDSSVGVSGFDNVAVGTTLSVGNTYDKYKWFTVDGSTETLCGTDSSLTVTEAHIGKKIRFKGYVTSDIDSAQDFLVAQATSTSAVPKLQPTFSGTLSVGAYFYGQLYGAKTIDASVASVTYGGIDVPGTFAFATPSVVAASGSASVVFTPTDSATYETVACSVAVTVEAVDPNVAIDFHSDYVNIGQATTVTVVPVESNPYNEFLDDIPTPTMTVEKDYEVYPSSGLNFTTEASDNEGTKYRITLSYPAVDGKYNAKTITALFEVKEDPTLPSLNLILTAAQAFTSDVKLKTVSYTEIANEADALAYATNLIATTINAPSINVKINKVNFQNSVKGTESNDEGVNGELVYTVDLSSGEGNQYCARRYEGFKITITAERYNKSTNNLLESLEYTVAGITTSVALMDSQTSYSQTLTTNVDGYSITFDAVAKDAKSTIDLGSNCTVSNGSATATIKVTAESGDIRTYTIRFSTSGMGGGYYNPGYYPSTPSYPTYTPPTTTSPTYTNPGYTYPPMNDTTTTTPPTTDTSTSTTPSTDASTMAQNHNLRYVDNTVRYKTSDRELVPYYIDSNGREVEVTISTYDAENGELVFVGEEGVNYLYRRSSRTYFSDISSHWARSYIEDVSRLNLFIGTSSGKFSPDLKMTYGMFVTVLGRMSGDNISSDSGYGPYTRWADANDITRSLPPLSENDQITRQDAAVLLMNFARYMGIDASKTSVARFLDGHTISSYAVPSVATLSYHAVINGRDNGNFDPFATLTRAETSVLILNVIPFILKVE